MATTNGDDDIRVGNPERERAISLLNDAFTSGYLDISEFDERSARIFAARTRGDLRSCLTDLPLAGQLFGDHGSSTALAPTAVPEQQAATFDADWETVRRRGAWQVPPRIIVTGSMGTVDFDFRKALMPGPLVDIELQVSTTTVKIRLAPDQEIRVDGIEKSGWSSIKDKAGPPLRVGGPVIVVRGSVSAWSGVTIKR